MLLGWLLELDNCLQRSSEFPKYGSLPTGTVFEPSVAIMKFPKHSVAKILTYGPWLAWVNGDLWEKFSLKIGIEFQGGPGTLMDVSLESKKSIKSPYA